MMSSKSASPSASRGFRKSLGFTQPLSFRLFLSLGTILTIFCLLHLASLARHRGTYGVCGAAGAGPTKGDCFHYARRRSFFWGLTIHLWTVLPAALLAVLQFVPAIRQRAPAVHRTLGYASLALCVPGIASTLALLVRSQGGGLSVRTGIAALGTASVYALSRAWHAIARKGRVDEHRAWMLRAWSYLGCIVTMRPLIGGGAFALSYMEPLHVAMPCEQLRFILEADGPANVSLSSLHPACVDGGAMSVVRADWLGNAVRDGRPDHAAAAGHVFFGASIWTALALHAVAVEWYLSRTRGESEKLKAVSKKYQARLGLQGPPEKKKLEGKQYETS